MREIDFKRRQRGVVLFLMAILATMILGAIGVAVDAGQLHWTRLRAQTAADAAVLAAVREQQTGSTFSVVQEAGRSAAASNGFSYGIDDTSVAIQRPATGALASDNSALEVLVTRTVPVALLRFLGSTPGTVTARAVGRLGPGTACLYALNKTETASLDIGGSTSIYLTCDAIVNSVAATAFKMHGSQTLYLKDGSKVGVVGGWSVSGGSELRAWPSGEARPPVRVADRGDPFAGKPAPSLTGLPVISTKALSYDASKPPAGGTAIPPGIYCGGLSIGDTGSGGFTMSGLYVMAGGGLKVNRLARVSGTDVTIYLTSGARSGVAGCSAPYDSFDINAQAQVQLTAPVNGEREGMLFFQDREITSKADHKMNGGSNTVLNGAVYIRNSNVTFNGNNVTTGYLILVADTIKIVGNSTFNSDYSSLHNGAPMQFLPLLVQ
jgi:Flp pilus assembly protein TadG